MAGDSILTRVDGSARQRWGPADSPVRFGRGRDRHILLCGPAQTAVSTRAGSLHFDGRNWWVTNESRRHPLYVVAHGLRTRLPLWASADPATASIPPPGVTLEFTTPTGPISVRVETEALPPTPIRHDDDDSSSSGANRPELPHNARLLLGAKFLSGGPHGPVHGDIRAAELVNRVFPGRRATAAAVMAAGKKAREVLAGFGVTGIDGPGHVEDLRAELLAWGVLTEADGRPFRGMT